MTPTDTQNNLSRRFSRRGILRFTLPSMAMMLCMSLYTIVDGIFVSRCVGTLALSALNMYFPYMGLMMGLAFMATSGGSALIAARMGEGRTEEARRNFSALMGILVGVGLLLTAAGLWGSEGLISLTGASEAQRPFLRDYLFWQFLLMPCLFLQIAYQTFFVTAGRPGLGLGISLAAGCTNMVLDYVLMVPLGMGVAGASLATCAGWVVYTAAGAVFFARRGTSLRWARPALPLRDLAALCGNGASEMVTSLALSVIGLLYNFSFMRLAGEDGVAALTVVFYFEFILTAFLFGFSNGISPVIAYKFGARDAVQLRFIVRTCFGFIAAGSLLAYLGSLLLKVPVLGIFLPPGSPVYRLASEGFPLYALSFLLIGTNIFTSALFTALGNGVISAIVSFTRTFFLLSACILLLPLWLGINGLWLAQTCAEFLALFLSLFSLRTRLHLCPEK